MVNEMKDPTELIRRAMMENGETHRHLAAADERWTTDELRRDFEVLSFLAPFVYVRRKADGAKGTMEFTHSPRFYFNFEADKR
jgi:hypothetical protein